MGSGTTTEKPLTGMWGTNQGVSKGLYPRYKTLGSLGLMTATPCLSILFCHILRNHDGCLTSALTELATNTREVGFFTAMYSIWPTYSDPAALKFIAVNMALALVLMRFLPGNDFHGPITPKGNVPIYKENGVKAYAVSILLFGAGVATNTFSGGVFYDVFPEMGSSLNLMSLILCVVLYVKGRWFPSSTDCGVTGNLAFDLWTGAELYPRFFGWDVKQFTNCRCGMMYWGVAPISFALKQYELHGFISDSMIVSVVLQLVYVSKFFYWETGYFETIDIMHDRAGFMLCWGCLVWVPHLYTISAHYLVDHPVVLGDTLAITILVLGLFCVILNYAIDQQRQSFRRNEGKIKIMGKDAKYIAAKYKTADGQERTSLLLTSGWWGLCRKFNYTLELMAAFSWSVPAMFTHTTPYLYFIFLVILLTDRAFRDNERCSSKYGKYWDQYCAVVPYILIPFVW